MSNLKYSVSASSLPSQITRQTSPPSPAEKKMSLTQTYVLAHTARGKLSKEASRPAHNLRRLVGHANMLDNLMLDLANAEQEQESWFNQSVKTASKSDEPKHIQWAETIPEEAMEDDDSDTDSDEEDFQIAQHLPIRRVQKSPPPPPKFDEDEDMEVDDEYDDSLALSRTSSHPPTSPPELMHEDSDSESEEESMPPSPPTLAIPFDAYTEKQRQSIGTTPLIQSVTPLAETEQNFFNHSLPAPITAY